MRLVEPAPAKLNLFLHVGPPGVDGYHPLASLMAFADIADEVALEPSEQMELVIDGPFAAELDAGPGNLVARARDAYLLAAGVQDAAFRLRLSKNLPPASGIGGGSADAAATLRLLHGLVDPPLDEDALMAVAVSLGADVPVCLESRAAFAEGRGEILSEPPRFPDATLLLANPGIALPTPAVFTRYDLIGDFGEAVLPDWPEEILDILPLLPDTRNDLQQAAIALVPQIAEVLQVLDGLGVVQFARMSGSGATCFAFATDPEAAQWAARRLRTDHPRWWVEAGVLKGAYP